MDPETVSDILSACNSSIYLPVVQLILDSGEGGIELNIVDQFILDHPQLKIQKTVRRHPGYYSAMPQINCCLRKAELLCRLEKFVKGTTPVHQGRIRFFTLV